MPRAPRPTPQSPPSLRRPENDPLRTQTVLNSASEFPYWRPGQVLDTVFIPRRPVHPSKDQHPGCVAQLLDVYAQIALVTLAGLGGLQSKFMSTLT